MCSLLLLLLLLLLLRIHIFCRYSADMEENANELHVCNGFNTSTRGTVYAKCMYVLAEYWPDCKPEGPLLSTEFVCLRVSVCLRPALLPFNVNRFWRNLVARTLLWSSLAATIMVRISRRGTARRLFTGSIALSANLPDGLCAAGQVRCKMPVFSLLRRRFWGFCAPQGRHVAPTVLRQGCRTPKIEIFTQIWPKSGI